MCGEFLLGKQMEPILQDNEKNIMLAFFTDFSGK
jgi:hypothetical protein